MPGESSGARTDGGNAALEVRRGVRCSCGVTHLLLWPVSVDKSARTSNAASSRISYKSVRIARTRTQADGSALQVATSVRSTRHCRWIGGLGSCPRLRYAARLSVTTGISSRIAAALCASHRSCTGYPNSPRCRFVRCFAIASSCRFAGDCVRVLGPEAGLAYAERAALPRFHVRVDDRFEQRMNAVRFAALIANDAAPRPRRGPALLGILRRRGLSWSPSIALARVRCWVNRVQCGLRCLGVVALYLGPCFSLANRRRRRGLDASIAACSVASDGASRVVLFAFPRRPIRRHSGTSAKCCVWRAPCRLDPRAYRCECLHLRARAVRRHHDARASAPDSAAGFVRD